MRIGHLFLIVFVVGCATIAPAPPTPRSAVPVAAPIGKVWDAVIDVFAERNIPIRTMDRTSGFISTDLLYVGKEKDHEWADCGMLMGITLFAQQATYNILVRGDSASSIVKATVRYLNSQTECTSRGTWEAQAEADIKARAEGTLAKKPDHD